MSQDASSAVSSTQGAANSDSRMGVLRIIVALAILGVGVYVALSPGLVYAPAPKIILYFLVALLPAILFGAEAAAKFKFNFPGFAFTVAGVAAIAFGALFLLTRLSKPEQQIAVFHIVDESGQPLENLDRPGAIDVPLTDQGLAITKFIDGNTVVLIFPEQVGEAELRVKPISVGKTYTGKITYSGNRESQLALGKQLK